MELTSTKKLILEAFLTHEEPVRPKQIAQEVGIKFPSVMMHIIGLSNMNYLTSPEKGYYSLTVKGKNKLKIHELTKENANNILSNNIWKKGFHFYSEIGKPLNIHTLNLTEFLETIPKVNTESIKFHLDRGDFKSWLQSLGDEELANRIANLKIKDVTDIQKKTELTELVKNRITELSDFV